MKLGSIHMVDILKPGKIGSYEIDHFEIVEGQYDEESRKLFNAPPPGRYARLTIDGKLYMSDTPMEKHTNTKFVKQAFGDVLIGGLGLGMVLLAIQGKPSVRSITVVEKYPEIIELIGNQLPLNSKVSLVCGDIYTYTPSAVYDVIYLDIWSDLDHNVWVNEMIPLKKRYNKFLKPKNGDQRRKVSCWGEYGAKSSIAPTAADRVMRELILGQIHDSYLRGLSDEVNK